MQEKHDIDWGEELFNKMELSKEVDRQCSAHKNTWVYSLLTGVKKAVFSVVNRPGNEDHPLKEILDTGFSIAEISIQIEKKLRQIFFYPITKPWRLLDQTIPQKMLGMPKAVYKPAAIVALFIGEFIRANIPIEQPAAVAPPLTYNKRANESVPSPGHTPEEALIQTASIEGHCEYMAQVCTFKIPNPHAYFFSYKMPHETLRKKGEACCNGYGSSHGEVLAHHGQKGYTISIWPAFAPDRLKNGWHQFTVICVVPYKKYVVMDSGEAFVHYGNLQQLIEEHYPGMVIMPRGIQLYQRIRRHPFATFGSHIMNPYVDEGEMIPDPGLLPEGEKEDRLPRPCPERKPPAQFFESLAANIVAAIGAAR